MSLVDKMSKLLQGMMFPSAVVSLDEQHNVGRSCSRDEDENNSDDEDDGGRSSNGQSSRSSTSLSSSNSTITDFAISSTDNNNNYTENGNNNNNNNNDSNNNNNNNHNNNNNLVWYFSYGSNMNPNVFEKKRNITPKQTRVCYVPDYVLTFGEGALPYVEPAFCTCIRRTELTKLQLLDATVTADTDTAAAADNTADSTMSKVSAVDDNRRRHSRRRPDIHGVAFLITKREFEHVLMTEGGWGWQEYRNNKLWNVGHYGSEEVNCIEIINNEQTATTTITSGNNGNDSGRKFKAYTLTGIMGDVRQRYDCNASKRYYDIVIDGAKTSGLPISYQNYLETNHKPFELLTHHKSLSSIKLARYVCCILSIPCIIMEIGSLSLCIKWNNYINGTNNEQSSSGCVVNVNNNTSYYSIRRPPWIICKISYLYRYIILEILLSIIIEDIFNIPNGFKNENENNNSNDMIEIVEIEKKKKKLKKNAVVQVVDYDVTKKVD